MSRYRFIIPRKALEQMGFFPSMKNKTYEEMQQLLFDAVSRGDIRAKLNDEVVSKAHIGIFLELYQRANPDQEPHIIPLDCKIDLDDLSEVFDRPAYDKRKRGRPRKIDDGWSIDRKLISEMHRMLATPPEERLADSATEAARILVEQGRVRGAGTPESRIKRLVRKFAEHYTS